MFYDANVEVNNYYMCVELITAVEDWSDVDSGLLRKGMLLVDHNAQNFIQLLLFTEVTK